MQQEHPAKWSSFAPYLLRNGPLAHPAFEGDPANFEGLAEKRILVVGAGGLGCEILKDLALSGFTDIHVIDNDTIDISNLNRQFLFRQTDVGKPKAEAAAAFVMKRCKDVTVVPYMMKIQDKPRTWYKKFDLVVAGLDNIEARLWLNETLNDLVQYDEDGDPDFETVIPLIDGGTEGFDGQTRVVIPQNFACLECMMQSMTETKSYPLCTIAATPRKPEHCIMWAMMIQWNKLKVFNSHDSFELMDEKEDQGEVEVQGQGAVVLDKDDPEHILWLTQQAEARAEKYNISGVNYNLTLGVVKNIIPAIASTNALISAACVNECWKYLTGCSQMLNNYLMYMGGRSQGIHSENFSYARNPNCKVCKPVKQVVVGVNSMELFEAFIRRLEGEVGEITSVYRQLTGECLLLRKADGSVFVGQDMQAQPCMSLLKDKDLLKCDGPQAGAAGLKVYVTFGA